MKLEKVGPFYIICQRQRLLLDMRSYRTIYGCEGLENCMRIIICRLDHSDIQERILEHFQLFPLLYYYRLAYTTEILLRTVEDWNVISTCVQTSVLRVLFGKWCVLDQVVRVIQRCYKSLLYGYRYIQPLLGIQSESSRWGGAVRRAEQWPCKLRSWNWTKTKREGSCSHLRAVQQTRQT